MSITIDKNHSKIEKQLIKSNKIYNSQDESLSSDLAFLYTKDGKDSRIKINKALNTKKKAAILFSQNDYQNSISLFLEVFLN